MMKFAEPYSGLAIGSVALLHCIIISGAQAQVTSDNTLPNPSTVTASGSAIVITGGSRSGSNLFHSFREFSVPNRVTASFQAIAPDVENVFSRVTGSSASRINGTIEALQTNGTVSAANFFLLNPYGILFGRNAALNVGGSFLATTADRILFANGVEFSAVAPSPLLTVSVPVGLQFGQTPGAIINRSIAILLDDEGNPVVDETGTFTGGLQVLSGETLALVGGQMIISGGYLTAVGGRIELGAVANSDFVGLSIHNGGLLLSYTLVQNFENITFSQSAIVDASEFINNNELGSGSIQLQGRRIVLTDESAILSSTTIEDGADIFIQAADLLLSNSSFIGTSTEGSANSGGITIATDRLILQRGAEIFAGTFAEGNAGNILIVARDSIELDGADSNLDIPTGLFTQVAETATGQGGSITLQTNRLQVEQGSEISTTTRGLGRAGDLFISATSIDLVGVFLKPNGAALLDRDGLTYPSGLFTDTDRSAIGNGGNLTIETRRLSVRDGAVLQTNTEGSGDAGNLTIRASEFVEVIGAAGEGLPSSFLFAASGGASGLIPIGTPEATGRGGTINIRTGELRVLDGAAIAVGSLNPTGAEGAGNLVVQAQTLQLANGGRLVAESASGDGGGIDLQIDDFVLLRNNALISTTAGTEQAGGNGGNLRIDTGTILAVPNEDSDLRANAFTGRGGNIDITANSIVGIEPRDRPTPLSDITASSEFGISGTITLNTPDADPTRGLVALPGDVVDASQQIAQNCAAGNVTTEELSEFVVTGRGGLPPNPNELLNSPPVAIPWATTEEVGQEDRISDRPLAIPSPPEIIEARNWMIGSNGEVVLTAAAPVARFEDGLSGCRS